MIRRAILLVGCAALAAALLGCPPAAIPPRPNQAPVARAEAKANNLHAWAYPYGPMVTLKGAGDDHFGDMPYPCLRTGCLFFATPEDAQDFMALVASLKKPASGSARAP